MLRKRAITTGKAGTDTYKYREASDFTPRRARDAETGPCLVARYFPEHKGKMLWRRGYKLQPVGVIRDGSTKPNTQRRKLDRAKNPAELWDTLAQEEPNGSTRYVSAIDCGMLVRHALKAQWPTVRFSVRCDHNSIDVRWTDGPTANDVGSVAKNYEGGRFDGMIDMAYSVYSWLRPDGTAALAHNPGTGGSRGSDPEIVRDPIGPDCLLVHFGASYVFCHRESVRS
jgi:hypothetical protein